MVNLVAGWAGDRTVYTVVDSAYAGQDLLDGGPATCRCSAGCARTPRCGPDPVGADPARSGAHASGATACRPPSRWRPRAALAAPARHPLRAAGPPLVFALTALWYAALPEQPVRIVVVRDPSGRRQDEAFFCTDRDATDAFILEGYARRMDMRSPSTTPSSTSASRIPRTRHQRPSLVPRRSPASSTT